MYASYDYIDTLRDCVNLIPFRMRSAIKVKMVQVEVASLLVSVSFGLDRDVGREADLVNREV